MPNVGDRRVVTRFLFVPTEIDGERRWLELVRIEQEYVLAPLLDRLMWVDVQFTDHQQKGDET